MVTSADDKDHATPRIGVLAMQGAFAEHVRALEQVGAEAFEVRTLAQLEACDAIVIPGGESTAIRKALDRAGLLEPLRTRITGSGNQPGIPAFGTCAGMIVLADTAPDGAPPCLGLLDVEVERNGWGRQVHSAEVPVAFEDGHHASAVFIRAPRITRVGAAVEVVARVAGDGDEREGADGVDDDEGSGAAGDIGAEDEPVAVRQGALLAAAFHPELTADRTLHELFVSMASTAVAHRTLADR